MAAVRELARVLRPAGQALIYVWALEQSKAGRHSTYLKQNKKNRKCSPTSKEEELDDENYSNSTDSTLHNFISDINQETISRPDESTEFKSLPVHENRTNFSQQDMLVPWKLKPQRGQRSAVTDMVVSANDVPVYHRYYHTFQENELEEVCRCVNGLVILRSYYDEGNWCVLLLKQD